MLILSGTPILGGVTAGMIGNNKETNIAKAKEGIFQFLNAAIPKMAYRCRNPFM